MLEIMKTIKYILSGVMIFIFFDQCTKESQSAAANPAGAGGSTARFTISGNYLYVVDHESLKSFLIEDPLKPVFKSQVELGINIETIFPFEDKLFIGSSSSMYIYSLANPELPQKLAKAEYTIRMSCDPVVAKDSVAYATLRASGPCGGGMSALVVYNIKNISSPIHVSTRFLSSPYGLGVKDSALYVCLGNDGLRIYNVKQPYTPDLSNQITLTDKAFFDVIPYGNILICQMDIGFVLYDIGINPLKPVFLSKFN